MDRAKDSMDHTTPASEGKPQADEQPIMRVKDLAVSFDNGSGPRIQAVDGVRMCVYPAQTLAVVGESGCGKSVTAMSSMQLIPRPPGRFDRGEIRFRVNHDGIEREVDLLTLDQPGIRRIRGNDISMIFQEPMTSLNPVYTVGDQILEAILLHQNVSASEARDIAVESMREVGIPNPEQRIKDYPHQFSGGMRQRVMIAMALACRPRLLLADEPTTALDVTIQAQILELIDELKRTRGTAVMLITHDLGVVAENADVVCVMYAGRVVEYASVFDLFDKPLHPYTRGLLASIPKIHEKQDRLRTIREVVDDESSFHALPGECAKLRPWWPWHDPPAGVSYRAGSSADYALVEPEPGHWVGVWATADVDHTKLREPDLSFRAPSRHAPATEAPAP